MAHGDRLSAKPHIEPQLVPVVGLEEAEEVVGEEKRSLGVHERGELGQGSGGTRDDLRVDNIRAGGKVSAEAVRIKRQHPAAIVVKFNLGLY